ncbi:MFS transporter, partial [Buchnera aphidicola]|nr:MFS transporter [Buchnera aphidicola]
MSFLLKLQYILKNIIEICIILFFIANIIFFQLSKSLIHVIFALQIFFISFNFLEIFLPSTLSKKIFKPYKGSVMSVYSTSQFLGIFLGGLF